MYQAMLRKTVDDKFDTALTRQIAFLGANNNAKPAFKKAPAPRNNAL